MLLLVLPAFAYVILSLPEIDQRICNVAKKELSELLGANVNISSAEIKPFSQVALNNISVTIADCDTVLTAKRLSAGIRLDKLFFHRSIVISYIELIEPDISLWKDSANSHINIQPIITKLKGNGSSKTKSFELAINSVVIRKGKFSYNVLSEKRSDSYGKFDYNNINISDIKADIKLPKIYEYGAEIQLQRLSMQENSGFKVKSLSTTISISDSIVHASNLKLALNNSLIDIDSAYVKKAHKDGKINHDSEIALNISKNTVISTRDIAYCTSIPTGLDNSKLYLSLDAYGTVGQIQLSELAIKSDDEFISLAVNNAICSGLPVTDSVKINIPRIKADIYPSKAPESISAKLKSCLDSLGYINLDGNVNACMNGQSQAMVSLNSNIGNIQIESKFNGMLHLLSGQLKSNILIDNLNLGKITHNSNIGCLTASITSEAGIDKTIKSANIAGTIESADIKGYNYNNLSFIGKHNPNETSGEATINNTGISTDVKFTLQHKPKERHYLKTNLKINSFNPNALNLTKDYPDYVASASVVASARFSNIDNIDGKLEIYDLNFKKGDNENGIAMNHFMLATSSSTVPNYTLVHSDIMDGNMTGNYKLSKLISAVKTSFFSVFPSLSDKDTNTVQSPDHNNPDKMNINLNLNIRSNQTTSKWLSFFKLPVDIVHPLNATANFNESQNKLTAQLKAPYLLKKDKFIDSTFVTATIDGLHSQARLHASTKLPSKQGPATINVEIAAEKDSIEMETNWLIETNKRFAGMVDINMNLKNTPANKKNAIVNIKPSQIIINDTIWQINPAKINIADKNIEINNFDVTGNKQFIKINGVISDNPFDNLCLELLNIDLDYIFETLNIGNAMFGGRATGRFYASHLFSDEPLLATPGLHVDGFKYNFSKLGDADIKSYWDAETRGIIIKADIVGKNKKHSFVDGAIYPLNNSLDINFNADMLDVGFMKPFMSAFASEVTGSASGKARLFGTFKNVNLEGGIIANDLRLKLDFTNTHYHTTDSIYLSPGLIKFDNIKLFDDYGNKARLDGWLTHDYFRNPEYEFRITDANKLLCFNLTDQQNPNWYGHVFCNGNATLKGKPGFIDMNIDVSTAPESVFTFVLNDNVTADEYTFLQFNDRQQSTSDLLLAVEHPEDANVKRIKNYYQNLKQQSESGTSSVFRINLQLDANPDGEINLVMDPVSGDKIRARGNGNMRLLYISTNDDLRMFGTYTLTQGTYNFTLQDIIIKDFSINPGSAITFRGDPYTAQLDIQAAYSVNANLSDLDESFMQDKDLNRTNVPVQALLNVNGDMRQPEITFDLGFPTLSQDVYRKVKSIVSTPEMMNRQIIYLLALNRFYTPDYIASTTRSNELMSVASSTISSQLTNILGQLSDKWSISPNFRSSKGDFSDMEVDLALSSHLLNNRLLFNGNFGYRDKSLNNNTFIGDFDIEYLLNKSGNIRLKAYNRYNDQNYFVRSALTTQGVGVIFKRDFDTIFPFLKKSKSKHKETADTTVVADTAAMATDNLINFKQRTTIEP